MLCILIIIEGILSIIEGILSIIEGILIIIEGILSSQSVIWMLVGISSLYGRHTIQNQTIVVSKVLIAKNIDPILLLFIFNIMCNTSPILFSL